MNGTNLRGRDRNCVLPEGDRLFWFIFRPDVIESGFDGLRVYMSHECADVPNLPSPGAMLPYFACEFNGC